jgi:hypothetical protein
MNVMDLFQVEPHCRLCNKPFKLTNSRRFYCSKACAKKNWRDKERARIKELERIVIEYNKVAAQ